MSDWQCYKCGSGGHFRRECETCSTIFCDSCLYITHQKDDETINTNTHPFNLLDKFCPCCQNKLLNTNHFCDFLKTVKPQEYAKLVNEFNQFRLINKIK